MNLHVNDLFTDLSDGKVLIRLLETISGEKIGTPGNIYVFYTHKMYKLWEICNRGRLLLDETTHLYGDAL